MIQTISATQKEKTSLPFFGIPRIVPYARKYSRTLALMVICGLIGTGMDIALPLFQRYALNHFIAGGTTDTLPLFIVIYVLAIVAAACATFVACKGGGLDALLANCPAFSAVPPEKLQETVLQWLPIEKRRSAAEQAVQAARAFSIERHIADIVDIYRHINA